MHCWILFEVFYYLCSVAELPCLATPRLSLFVGTARLCFASPREAGLGSLRVALLGRKEIKGWFCFIIPSSFLIISWGCLKWIWECTGFWSLAYLFFGAGYFSLMWYFNFGSHSTFWRSQILLEDLLHMISLLMPGSVSFGSELES